MLKKDLLSLYLTAIGASLKGEGPLHPRDCGKSPLTILRNRYNQMIFAKLRFLSSSP